MENYDKLKEIGKGSYGVVWLVKSKREKKNFVLKRIDLRKTSDRDKLSAQQEAQLLKNLKHPNIVAYKESFQIDGYLNIVMLFCDGGDLYTKIKEQNGKFLEETQIVEWFVQIAMALQYLHDKNILHRDLKTQNIFLTKNKIVKVGDLGIARVLKSNSDMATTIIGTPYYMSPELFSNKPYNSKSDVWALGCCVYEMTTLKHAFNAKDMTSLVLKITRGKMPTLPQHYSKDLIILIESMLNPDPKNRPSVGRILRDQFIKKNIMLFLERTKLKQEQQQIIEVKKEPIIRSNQQLKQVNKSNNSDSDTEFHRNKQDLIEANKKQNKIESLPTDFKKPVHKTTHRVRISSVVQDIETKEHFQLEQTPKRSSEYDDEEEDQSSDETHKPYELTKPIKNIPVINYEPEEVKVNRNKVDPPVVPNHQPKIIGQSYGIMPRRAPPVVQPVVQVKSEQSSNILEDKVATSLDARERRRQRLRLSQNDSNESKPPILRRLEKKSHHSEIFYDSNKASVSSGNKNGHVSKSYNEVIDKHDSPLQDSLKIFRKINPMSPQPNREINPKENMFFPKRPQPIVTPLSQSSSSSSVASSNDDNDPTKDKLRNEKKKKREKKEMDSFIDQLSSTLNLAILNNKNDSEVEDIKDEILEDLEEEAIQAELNNSDKSNKKLINPVVQARPKRTSFFNSSYSNDDDDKEEEEDDDISNSTITQVKSSKPKNESNDLSNINNLGATNHMHNRINQLENEFIKMIGREKLDEAFKILDSFKEDEIKPKLVKLIGQSLYDANSGKLWLLKFCKDTAKISIR